MAAHAPLADTIYATLRDQIMTVRLKPGESLQEVRLAELFRVSRTPIREALRMLTREGLVEILPRQGTYVAALSVRDVLDAFEIRYHLEPAMVRKAAPAITPEAVAKMNVLVESFVERPTSFDHVLGAERADVEFHDVILTLAGNALVQKMVRDVRLKIQRLAFSVPPARYRQSHDEHRAIIHALSEGDGDVAETRMREHIQSARLTSLDIVSR